MLPLAGKVTVLEPTMVQSLKRMRNAFSLSGTVKCKTHSHPFWKVLSAMPLVLIASMLVTASGVEVDVDVVTKVWSALVVDASPLLLTTRKWYSVPLWRLVRLTDWVVELVPAVCTLP